MRRVLFGLRRRVRLQLMRPLAQPRARRLAEVGTTACPASGDIVRLAAVIRCVVIVRSRIRVARVLVLVLVRVLAPPGAVEVARRAERDRGPFPLGLGLGA